MTTGSTAVIRYQGLGGAAPGELNRSYKTNAPIHDLSRSDQAEPVAMTVADRSRRLLGPDANRLLATALNCSQARFKSPSVTVVVIVELLEAAQAAGIAHEHLPARWRGETVEAVENLRARFAALFSPRPVVRTLRDAIGLTDDVLNRRLKASPETRQAAEFLAVAELLEIIAAAGGVWPARWRERSDPHDGLAWKTRAMALLGPAAASRLGQAVDLTADYIGRAFRGERDSRGRRAHLSGSLCAVIELLETLEREGIPRECWPARWHRCAYRVQPASDREHAKGACLTCGEIVADKK